MDQESDNKKEPRNLRRTLLFGGLLLAAEALFAMIPLAVLDYMKRSPNTLGHTDLPLSDPELQEKGFKELAIGTTRAIVFLDSERVEAFNLECTHMACGVRWNNSSQIFYCPCHGGEFTRQGHVKKGPPKRPLSKLAFKVRNGVIRVYNSKA